MVSVTTHTQIPMAIVQTIASEARDGDLVLVMSNGGFDGIHGKLLSALGVSETPHAG